VAKRVGINDIAKAAGVSPTTVSHALNGKGRIPAETRARVQAVAKRLGYTAHAQARALATGRSFTLAIQIAGGGRGAMVPDFSYFIELLNCASEAAIEAGYGLVVVPPGLSKATVRSLPIDGAIVVDPTGQENLLTRRDVALVTTSRAPTKGRQPLWVDNDQTHATRQVLEHFASEGCIRPALLTTPPGQSYVDDVVASYQAWCIEHGCEPLIERVNPPATEAAALPAALRLLGHNPRPDGIYATLDRTAIGIVQAAGKLKLSVPEDLLVAAVTDSPLLAASNPPVTALDLNAPEIGRRAVQLLIAQLEHTDGSLESITVPSTLIVRASSMRRPTRQLPG
jgi:DNA-binding LacI/PurR family transcriptional regulator